MRRNNYMFGASELRIVESWSATRPSGKVHRPAILWGGVPEDIEREYVWANGERGAYVSNASEVRRDGPSAVTVARRVHATLDKIAQKGRAAQTALVARGPRLVKR